jgi:DNA-binding MarR family transcriptional regulator
MPDSKPKPLIDPDNPPLAFDLLRANEWFEQATERSAEALGMPRMSKGQNLLLAHIGRGEHRPSRLARNLGISRQAVSVMIGDLERAGILVVQQDPDHARATIVDFHDSYAGEIALLLDIFASIEAHLGGIIGFDRLAVVKSALRMDWGEPPSVSVQRDQAPAKARRVAAGRKPPQAR